MRARASAPPGGYRCQSMLLSNRSYVQAPGPSVSLTLNNAPAKDALMSLARLGGYGFVYVSESDQDADQANPVGVTMAFRDERFDRALNSVLLASGLQARLDGQTLMWAPLFHRRHLARRCRSVSTESSEVNKAADYLRSWRIDDVINTITTTTGEPSSVGTNQLSNQASRSTQKTTKVETYGAD